MRNPILDIAKTKAWITMILFQTMHPPLTQRDLGPTKTPFPTPKKNTPHVV